MNAISRSSTRMARTALTLLLLVLTALPLAAAAACSGKLANLQSYAGKGLEYNAQLTQPKLFDEPAIAKRLKRLSPELRLQLQRDLDVSGQVKLDDCHLRVTGNLPHQGGLQGAILDVDLASGTLIAGIHDRGRIDIYVLADTDAGTTHAAWNGLPRAVREWAVRADSGLSIKHPQNLTQPASVRLHVPPRSAAPADTAGATGKVINFGKDSVKPTPAQDAAIRRATGDDLTQPLPGHAGDSLYSMALADFNDDGRPDLVVMYAYATGFCGSAGCNTVLVMATPEGYAPKAINLAYNGGEIDILHGKHHGMHDLRYNGDSPPWYWNGKEYVINKNPSAAHASGSARSGAAPWKNAQAPGHPLTAYAAPIDSTIKHLMVLCEQGRPLLTMLTKAPRPGGPATLTFVFNGWTVNLPMQRNIYNTNLWMADLSRSDLPLWLAHRGNNATTQSLASAADMAYLRINGRMEGQISLANSTAATQAALGSCYRY